MKNIGPYTPITWEESGELLRRISLFSISVYPNAPRDRRGMLLNEEDQGAFVPDEINRSGIGSPCKGKWPVEQDRPYGLILEWGRDRARRDSPLVGASGKHPLGAFNGTSECYNAVILAVLSASNSPMKSGRTIEVLKLSNHFFTVVNRPSETSIQEPKKWGPGCMIVDVWYGLQDDTDAVKYPSSRHDDVARYLNWLDEVKKKNRIEFEVVGTPTVTRSWNKTVDVSFRSSVH